MDEALELARKGQGRTSPNPAVGAVLVRDGQIVGRGYHVYARADHAERVALRKRRSRPGSHSVRHSGTLLPSRTYRAVRAMQ